jgi:hypothetical protein
MVNADDLAIEAEAGHQQEPTLRDQSDVDADGASARNSISQTFGVPAQAELTGHEVFRARRQDCQGDGRLLVEQVRYGTVSPDGHKAATMRVAGGTAHECRSLLGGPGDLRAQPRSQERRGQSIDQPQTLAQSGISVCDDPDPATFDRTGPTRRQ